MADLKPAELDLDDLLAAPPRDEAENGEDDGALQYALLELALTFPRLNVIPERLALWPRVFIITQDPLSWIADRGHAWTSASTDGRVLEIGIYLDLDEVQRARAAAGGELAAALGRYGETAMRTAFAHEAAFAGDGGVAPPLLAGLEDYDGRWGVPVVAVRSDGWEDVGLGALQDLVHDAFGDVSLDRSAVALAPIEPQDDDCPACDGERFAFPTGLDQAQEQMCPAHAAAANAVKTERLAHARASNPAGWRAIDKAAARINGEPEPMFAPQPQRTAQSISRNDPCPCGSGLKYKRCHGA
jgi:SEC-C motif